MTCGSCVVAVKKALIETKGVKTADVSLEKGLANVVYEDTQVTEKQLREAINKSGFAAEPSKGTH
jgi:copper chaperone CopZ